MRADNVRKLADYFEHARLHYRTMLTLDVISEKLHSSDAGALCITFAKECKLVENAWTVNSNARATDFTQQIL